MDQEGQKFSKKNIMFAILGLFIVLNIFFFPELLNHSDIKLNDMSYLIPNSSGLDMQIPPVVEGNKVADKGDQAKPVETVEPTPANKDVELPKAVVTTTNEDITKVIQPKSSRYLVILLMLLVAVLGSFSYYAFTHREEMSLLKLPTTNSKNFQKTYNNIFQNEDNYHLLED
jgi:hypothetical protein